MTDLTTVQVLTHLGTFVFGVGTCRAMTIWEGKRIKKRGETMTDEAESKPRPPLSRNTIIAVFVIVISLLFVGLGFQQVQYQRQGNDFRHRFLDSAQCYNDWGKALTKALDKRVTANTKQTRADHIRANSSDNVLLVVLGFQKANPPLTPEMQREQFRQALTSFAKAKAAQVKVDKETNKTREANPYPKLDCENR